MKKDNCILSSSIFKRELLFLRNKNVFCEELYFLDVWNDVSTDNNFPVIKKTIETLLERYENILVFLGAQYNQLLEENFCNNRVKTLDHNNAYELLLGSEEYSEGIKDGTAYLLPEKITLWARDMVPQNVKTEVESLKSFLYLDTGIITVPYSFLRILSGKYGMPYNVKKVSLDMLKSAISEGLAQIKTGEPVHQTA